LHDATQKLRQSSSDTDVSNKVGAITKIFGIETDDVNSRDYKESEPKVKG